MLYKDEVRDRLDDPQASSVIILLLIVPIPEPILVNIKRALKK